MDAVDDIFSNTPSLSLWESPHLTSAFPLASASPPNPQNFLPAADNSDDTYSFHHPLADPQELPPDLSAALASSFALPNSLPFSIPPNLFSQSIPADNLPFDINSLPSNPDPRQQQPSFDPTPQFHQPKHFQSTQSRLTQSRLTQSRRTPQPTQPKSSHKFHPVRRNPPPTANPSIHKTRPTRQPKQTTHPQPTHPQPTHPQPTPDHFFPNNSTASTRPPPTHSTSLPEHQQHHHIPTSHSNSNLLSDHNSSAPISRLSSISIPTPTIATATTTAGSPSTTNATHRSPPHTPPSAKPPKSTATSNPKPHQHVHHKHTQPTPSNHHRTTQTSVKQHSALPTPTSPSASTVLHATHRVSKPRDKHARLRKRLKCCSQDQLVDHIIQLVRSSTIPEKIITDNLPKVDIHRYVQKCRELREAILSQLPDHPANPTAPFDATAFRKCKKPLAVFRTSVVNMAKTLVEASLWTDVIHFCIAADAVNAETPLWSEPTHNKTKRSVRTKLEQFALKAATALSKPKEAAAFNRDDHAKAMQACQGVFPDVLAKLKRHTPSAPTESQTRSQDYEDPMISATHLHIDI